MKRSPRVLCLALTLLVGCMILTGPSYAIPYGFENITNNNSVNAAIGESQLFVEVLPFLPSQVFFLFLNVGVHACSITDVYFDDGTPGNNFSGIWTLVDKDDGLFGHSGVDFSPGAAPPDLPGGTNVGFSATPGLAADSDSPASSNGVNPGEYLGVILNLVSGRTLLDVISAMNRGDLRIGLHVQSFPDGGSEAFATGGHVPEPSTLVLIGAGLFGFAFRRRQII